MQHEFEQLAEENKRLRDELEKWKAYAGRLQTQTNPALAAAAASRPATPVASATPHANAAPAPQGETVATSTPAGATRAYVVKEGDAPYSIAKRHGVKLEALMAANPGLDPRRLRVGQTLVIPPP
jgi:peptidoglycan endopeptidase LytF